MLILLNVLSVVVFLVWLGCHGLRDYKSSFSTGRSGRNSVDLFYPFLVVALAAVPCGTYSFFAPAGAAKFFALAPLAFIALGQGYLSYALHVKQSRYDQEEAAQRAIWERKLEQISKDYVLVDEAKRPGDPFKASFLTRDRDLDVLVRIDVGYGSDINAYPFGKIQGTVLETTRENGPLEKWYRQYLDREGKSVYDRYTVRQGPDPDAKAYRLEKYQP